MRLRSTLLATALVALAGLAMSGATASAVTLGHAGGLKYVRTFHADWPEKIEGDEEGDVEYALTPAEWEERGKST